MSPYPKNIIRAKPYLISATPTAYASTMSQNASLNKSIYTKPTRQTFMRMDHDILKPFPTFVFLCCTSTNSISYFLQRGMLQLSPCSAKQEAMMAMNVSPLFSK
jgi:hypothetical protein